MPVRKIVAYKLLSLDGVGARPDAFITDRDDAIPSGHLLIDYRVVR